MRLTRENLELIRRAWLSQLSPSVKLVLLAYCLHANEQGLCWQSLARTAALTGLNPRTVQRHIRTLEAAGALVPLSKPRAATQTYQINLQALGLVTLNTQPAQPQQPTLQGMEQPDDSPELDFDFDLDFSDLPELPAPTPEPNLIDTLPPLPEFGTFGAVDNFSGNVDNLHDGGGNLYSHPRQFVQTPPAVCAVTPGTMPPKLYELNRTDEGTEHAAPAPELPALTAPPSPTPPASPASRPSAPPPVVVQPKTQEAEAEAETLARFAALHQRKGHGPVTAAVLENLTAEGARAGMTLPQVLAHCLERKWGTFEARWLKSGTFAGTSAPRPAPAMPGASWTVNDGSAHDTTPESRAAARVLADLQAATQQPPASRERVAHHLAKLTELRASYVAAGARVRPSSAARAALH